MNKRTRGNQSDIVDMSGAKRESNLLQSGDPELIAELAKAMTEDAERVKMRINIKDKNGEYIDNFVTDVAPAVGDFIDLTVHGELKTYEVVERRLSLSFFTDSVTNMPARVRQLEIIARLLPA